MIAAVVRCQDVRGTVRVACHCVEIDHIIECATAANPLIDGFAFLLLIRVVIPLNRRALEGIFEGRQRGADDAHPVKMSTCDELLVAIYDRLCRRCRLVRRQDTVRPADVR